MQKKSALISIIGKPNAGKSTLLNRLIGQKISIVTPKVQTTRNMIQGITTRGDTQLIFIDTPGIFEPKKRLEKAMVRAAWSSIVGADMVLVMLDCRYEPDEMEQKILGRLRENGVKFVVVVNKIDLSSSLPKVLDDATNELKPEENILFPISARTGEGVEALEEYLIEGSKAREWLYDEEEITNIPMRFLASEITREQLFLNLEQELPYNLTVETEKWEEFRDGSVKINQVIIIARESQKGILLGKIKKVGERAREEITSVLGFKVHLFLFVKVRENWDSGLVHTIANS